MKVLFISHLREATGNGQASRDLALAMDSIGIDVVCRAIKLNNIQAEMSPKLLELEGKSSLDCDVCIQFLLPHHMKFDGSFKKTIALYDYETFNFATSGWPNILNMFPEVWTPNNQAIEQGKDSGIISKQYCVPHAIDPNKFKGPLKKILDGSFFFYFIGEANQRKNLGALVKAFHTEFGKDENVSLVIKTSKWGHSPQQTFQIVESFCDKIKHELRLYPNKEDYKKELVITERLTEEQILNLHYSSSVFVMPSRGEGQNLPSLDSLAMGNPVICSNVGGLKDIGTHKIDGQLVPAEGCHDTFPELYTGFEDWFECSVSELKMWMRYSYENYKTYDRNIIKSTVEKFHYKNIGQRILDLLTKQDNKVNY